MAFIDKRKNYPMQNNASAPVQKENDLPSAAFGNMLSPIMTPALMREMATIYSQMAVAQARPRSYAEVQKRIDNVCARESLAAMATYAYAKGGTDISGPSIRLAEAVASAYGNFKYGFEVAERNETSSKVRAYAFDMETNVQAERIYDVPHIRDTKHGSYAITDSREIYELEANMSARRVRACILEIIPKDLIDYAVDKCDQTLRIKLDLTPEAIKKMVTAFKEEFDIPLSAIENFIQRKVETIHKSQFIRLRSIYRSLKDGIAKPEDFFDLAAPSESEPPQSEPEPAEEPVEEESFADYGEEAAQPVEDEEF